jgi:hypothetical protein
MLWCGAIGPPLFVLAALIEGATRPGYDPARLPFSLLALGELGWMQTANFIVAGLLMIAFAIGLRRSLARSGSPSRNGPIFIGLFGVGLLGAGAFSADPGGGFPPGVRPTAGSTGMLHDLSTLVVFGSLIAASAILTRHFAIRGERAWALYSAATSAAVAVGFVMMFVGFSATNDITPVAGVVQRITVVIGWTWVTLLALHELRRGRDRRPGYSAQLTSRRGSG